MPTVIDSLVVTLGLDARNFTQGQRQALNSLNNTQRAAGQTSTSMKRLSDDGRRTSQALSSQGKVAGEYFDTVRNKALALLSVLVGGKGLTETIRSAADNMANLGRASVNIGVNVQQLAAFRNTVEANGGSADAAAASFQKLSDSMAELKLTGQTAILPALNIIGASRGMDAMQTYQKFVEFASRHKNDVGLTRQIGMRLGLDEGSINEALRGTVQVAKDLSEAMKRGVPTQDMVTKATALQRAWIEMEQAMTNLVNLLTSQVGPTLTGIFKGVTNLIQNNPVLAEIIGLAATGLGAYGGMKLIGRVLGGGRAVAGLAGVAGGVGGGSLIGAAAALTGAAEALTAAAVALGGAGVAGKAGLAADALGAAGGAGRAGRYATSAGARAAGGSIVRRVGGKLLRWVPFVGWVAAGAEFLAGTSTSSDDTTMAPNTGGYRGGDPKSLGMTDEQYDTYRNTLGKRESGGRYGIVNSYGYAGKYQFGGREIKETALSLGEQPPTREQFLKDPAMQERYMLQYTLAHHKQLMNDPVYKGMSPEERGGALATAHLKGVGGALRQLHGGSAGTDAYGTSGASYATMMTGAMRHAGNDNRPDNSGGQTVHVNGPIVIHTQATDAKGISRDLRTQLSGRQITRQANTGLA